MGSDSAEDTAEAENAANISPLLEEVYRKIMRVHNTWMGHRGVDVT